MAQVLTFTNFNSVSSRFPSIPEYSPSLLNSRPISKIGKSMTDKRFSSRVPSESLPDLDARKPRLSYVAEDAQESTIMSRLMKNLKPAHSLKPIAPKKVEKVFDLAFYASIDQFMDDEGIVVENMEDYSSIKPKSSLVAVRSLSYEPTASNGLQSGFSSPFSSSEKSDGSPSLTLNSNLLKRRNVSKSGNTPSPFKSTANALFKYEPFVLGESSTGMGPRTMILDVDDEAPTPSLKFKVSRT